MVDRGSWEVVRELGLSNAAVDAETLRAVAMNDLLAAYFELDEDHIQPAVIARRCGDPGRGCWPLADPRYAKNVPVMAGTTRDEVTLWLGLSRYFVDVSYPLSKALPAKLRIKDPALYAFWVDMRSRGWKLGAVDDPLSGMREAGYTELYAYRYDWDEQPDNYFVPFSEILGAAHANEIAFIMGAPMYGAIGDYMYPDTDSAAEMTEIMMTHGVHSRGTAPASARWPGVASLRSGEARIYALDVGGQLGLSDDVPGRDKLLSRVAVSDAVSELERCCWSGSYLLRWACRAMTPMTSGKRDVVPL